MKMNLEKSLDQGSDGVIWRQAVIGRDAVANTDSMPER